MNFQRWAPGLVVILIIAAVGFGFFSEQASRSAGWRADPDNAERVAQGKQVYDRHCASCHGANLEGQPEWRKRKPDGRLPAPPHDESGHTWHHPDQMLFEITKYGLIPPNAPDGYQSDMPAFNGMLSDTEIWAVLSYIKSRWPAQARQVQAEIDAEARQRTR